MEAERPGPRHYPAWVREHLDYPPTPLYSLLEGAAARWGDRTATEFYGAKLTYAQVWRQARAFAGALAELGVEPGQRVAIMLPNCPQMVIAFYGALLAGATVVMTNPLYMERELAHQLADSGATALVFLDLLWGRVQKVAPAAGVNLLIPTSIKDYLPFPLSTLYPLKAARGGTPLPHPNGPGVHPFKDLQRRRAEPPALPAPDVKRDVALLQYTGGTTGVAKGAMLSHHNLVANMLMIREWIGDQVKLPARFLCIMPFFHVYGLTGCLNFSVFTGSTMILMPRFEVYDALKLIARSRPTVLPGAPPIYAALANHPRAGKFDLSSVEICISGAAPLPAEVQAAFERRTGARIVEGYGLTEAAPVTHITPVGGPHRPGSIGLPLPDVETRLVDLDTGEREVGPGEPGELLVRSPGVMLGYWGRPDETAAVLHDGWLHTGDVVQLDAEGFAYVVDRKKDMIICSGYNVYPREVEEVLHEHPAVLEAAVAGVPDEYRGQTVRAFVVLRPEAEAAATEAELIAFCRQRLAAYKVPTSVEFRTSLPKTLIGKVLRRLLLEEAVRA